jgi:hypothetical protein
MCRKFNNFKGSNGWMRCWLHYCDQTGLGQAVLLTACIDYSMVRRGDRCRRCSGEVRRWCVSRREVWTWR